VFQPAMTSTTSRNYSSGFTQAIPDFCLRSDPFASAYVGKIQISTIGRFIFEPALEAVIDIDNEGVFTLESVEGNFYEIGETMDDLKKALEDTIEFVWKEYAKGQDKKMSGDAIEYKEWLNSRMRVI